MTRISSRQGVLLLLQERLARLAAERGAGSAGRPSTAAPELAPMKRLRRTLTTDDLTEEERTRALVRSILLDAMDEALGADPRFERLTDEVTRILRASDGGGALVDAVLYDLAQEQS